MQKAAQKGMNHATIAKKMERSLGSILARFRVIAVRMIHAEGKTVEEAAEATRLSADDIRIALSRQRPITVTRSADTRSADTPPIGALSLHEGGAAGQAGQATQAGQAGDTAQQGGAAGEDEDKTHGGTVLPVVSIVPPDHTALTEDQRVVFRAVKCGANILLTGPPGTGKTYTMKYLIAWARSLNMHIGVTAMTGAAAVLLGGQTLHSFLGIGLGAETAEWLAYNTTSKYSMRTILQRLRRLQILLIDEVSMMNAELLEKISDYLAMVRNIALPFGGVQVILVGDFCQLPPVEGRYCFKAPVWKLAEIHTVVLETNVRQKDDPIFQRLLRSLRWGECGDAEMAILEALKDTEFPEGIVPTRLYPINRDVDAINEARFTKLKESGAASATYEPRYPTHTATKNAAKRWAQSAKMDEPVEMCPGAQVMLVRNLDLAEGLVNGARGVVTAIRAHTVDVRFLSGATRTISYYKAVQDNNPDVWVEYLPLKLAWAFSVHKAQGATLDAVEMDLGRSIFADGQAYTALSRARSLASVRLTDVAATSFRTSAEVKTFYGVHDTDS